MYFLRSRGLWYVDDFAERFAGATFLTYEHPPGETLKKDFQLLSAAADLAKSEGRKLVLPDTMNCRNSPAFGPSREQGGGPSWRPRHGAVCTRRNARAQRDIS